MSAGVLFCLGFSALLALPILCYEFWKVLNEELSNSPSFFEFLLIVCCMAVSRAIAISCWMILMIMMFVVFYRVLT